MSKKYRQLSQEQRYQIDVLLRKGHQQNQIAELVGVSASTICRELVRNRIVKGRYDARRAQVQTRKRHQVKAKRLKFNDEMKKYCTQKMLIDKWSPELISVEGKRQYGEFVSHETIYGWLWKCKKTHRVADAEYRTLYMHLRHGKRRRKRGSVHNNRACIPNRTGIEQRPMIVSKRKRLGDLEVDLMIGKKDKYGVLTLVDRSTLKTWLRKMNVRDAQAIKKAIIKKMAGNTWIKTFTFDNDQAFARHTEIATAFHARTFFTKPYTSQDKGTVENRIGILRRFLPKGTDLSGLSHQKLRRIEEKLNKRPVRKFHYKTPNQMFSEKIALIT